MTPQILMYSVTSKAPQKRPRVIPTGRDPGSFGGMAEKRLEAAASAAGLGEAHLDTLLVAFEEVGARVPGAVPFEELLSKPAVEALVVLALHVSASLPDAVHGAGS